MTRTPTPTLARHTRTSGRRGFTLIELLVVLIIGGILATMLTQTLIQAVRNHSDQVDRQVTLQQSRITFERLARDVRTAYPLRELDSDTLRLRTVRNDRWIDVTYEFRDTPDGRELVVRTDDDGPFRGSAAGAVASSERILATGLADTSEFSGTNIDGDPATNSAAAVVEVRLQPAEYANWTFMDSAAVRAVTDARYQ